jgi:RNA ligase
LKITELFTHEQFQSEVQYGYVKLQKHPFLPLIIANYTDKATYERRWNAVTIHCRGLIFNSETSELVARGPRKFFNYGEPSAKEWPLHTPVRVSRKEDGSLGIGWCYEDGEGNFEWGIATRGSFTSEQAIHATALLTDDDMANIDWADGFSRIWEIVYPENRIVLDYGGRDELIPLGTVNHRTGIIQWRPRSVAHSDVLGDIALAEAIALRIPDDEEGYVLDILNDDGDVIDHLKLKGDRYKELHAAIFGLTEARVYEAWLTDGGAYFIEGLPDEVQPWALAVAQRLDLEWAFLMSQVRTAFEGVPSHFNTRKVQAEYILENHKELSAPLFALLDHNVSKAHAWVDKQIKPGHVPFTAVKENA